MTQATDPRKRTPRRRFGTNSATMADVAGLAGVSAQTVSRVLRDPEGSAPETRERVMEAVRATNYVQNHAASHLASNRSLTVAAVIPQIAASVFAETVQGLSNVLLPAGYQIVIGHTDYSLEREEALVRSLLGRRPAAFFLVGTMHSQSTRDMLGAAGVPIVESWEWVAKPIDRLVGFSNRLALAEMVAYLKGVGYKQLTFAGAVRIGDSRAQERIHGFCDGIAQHFPRQKPRVVTAEGLPYAMSTGSTLLDMVLQAHPQTDAIVFSSDLFASGALLACQRRGIAVPGQLAISGFGDYEIARELQPALTTVAVPTMQIGEEAAKIILRCLRAEKPAARKIDLGFRIIGRESA